ncbi:MAG: PD40 domain-containing protein [Chloroflexi bacterium]|nr:PD40 domain-containing protein [Chloroflexota bacterium]
MKRQSSLIVIMALALLVGAFFPSTFLASVAHAQNPAVVVVYTDLNDNILLFDSSTGATQTLIAAEAGRRIEYRILLSPDNSKVAIYSYSFDLAAARAGDTTSVQDTLAIFTLPEGENLMSETLMLPNILGVGSNEDEFPPMSISDFVAWSPDGSRIAWITNNPGWNTVHVYPSSLNSQPVQDLIPNEASVGQLSTLRWSPDGTQLAYTSVTSFKSEDGSPQTNGVYTYSLTDNSGESLTVDNSGAAYWFLGWDTDNSLLWSPFGIDAGATGLYRYDLAAGTDTAIIPTSQPMSRAAIDATTQTVAFAVPNLSTDGSTTQAGLAPGAYVLGADDQPQKVFTADNLYGVNFIQSDLLEVGDDVIIRLSNNTQLNMNLLRRAIFSPDGTQAVGEKESKTFLRELATEAETEIYSLYFVDGAWLDASSVIMKVGAYGSVIGVWQVGGSLTQLIEDSGDGPFVGVLR